jgi:hypothetical protein
VRNEQPWKLKKHAMAGVRLDDQLSLGDSLRKIVGIDRRNHDVVVSIHNEGRLPDVSELGVTLAAHFAPSNDRGSLSGSAL